jgi:hypothetical protein
MATKIISSEQPAEQTPEERVPVSLVGRYGPSVLVEWVIDGRSKRAVIPAQAIAHDGTADRAELDLGVPYGLPWESLVTPTVTADTVAECLRRAGIWTAADLNAKPQAALGALQAAYMVDLGALLTAASNHKE